jgi:hypothetical protein
VNATGQHGTRAADALRIIDDEGLSVRDVADWCSSGIRLREVAQLRRLTHDRPTATVDEPLTVDEHAQRQGDGPGQAPRTVNDPATVEAGFGRKLALTRE